MDVDKGFVSQMGQDLTITISGIVDGEKKGVS